MSTSLASTPIQKAVNLILSNAVPDLLRRPIVPFLSELRLLQSGLAPKRHRF